MIAHDTGTLYLGEGVTLEGGLDARQLRRTPLVAALRPVVMNPPFATLQADATLAEGIPVRMTLVFAFERLVQVSFRFRYPPDVDETLVHQQHCQWLDRSLGAVPYVADWGMVSCDYDPRNDESNVVLTWRGLSDLYDQALPPLPSR
jgi:hypothetical protein